MRSSLIALLVLTGIVGVAFAEDPVEEEPCGEEPCEAPAPSEEAVAAARAAFPAVASVLQHPRCLNCHPDGDAPLQTDASTPHKMGVTRDSPDKGLPCNTCHREQGLALEGLPPANPHWHMPPANQVFQGLSPAALCAQLNDPERTGGRDLDALLEHVSHDSLVLYGWDPGPGRSTPPLSHADFVAAFSTWVEGGGACPD